MNKKKLTLCIVTSLTAAFIAAAGILNGAGFSGLANARALDNAVWYHYEAVLPSENEHGAENFGPIALMVVQHTILKILALSVRNATSLKILLSPHWTLRTLAM